MITQIKENIWQFKFKNFGSHAYLIKLNENKSKGNKSKGNKLNEKNILIDTSSSENIQELKNDLKKLNLTPQNINIVILTHNHWDHMGGLALFLKSKIYGSKKDFGENLLNINKLKIKELKIIQTPGHSKGGICILYKDILFSGDTLFHRGNIGRTDLPGGSEKEIKNSLKKLSKIKYKILCPGHGY